MIHDMFVLLLVLTAVLSVIGVCVAYLLLVRRDRGPSVEDLLRSGDLVGAVCRAVETCYLGPTPTSTSASATAAAIASLKEVAERLALVRGHVMEVPMPVRAAFTQALSEVVALANALPQIETYNERLTHWQQAEERLLVIRCQLQAFMRRQGIKYS